MECSAARNNHTTKGCSCEADENRADAELLRILALVETDVIGRCLLLLLIEGFFVTLLLQGESGVVHGEHPQLHAVGVRSERVRRRHEG